MKTDRMLNLMWIPLVALVAFSMAVMGHALNAAERDNAVLKAKLEMCRCANEAAR